MRIVFYSLSDLTIKTAQRFIEKNHEVIIIDTDTERIEQKSEQLDCGFLVGDASHPATLKETNPKSVDIFFALSDSSQNNLVACLVARSLGIERTILQVQDPDYENICMELGLNEVIFPTEIASQYLYESILNKHLLNSISFIKEKACLYKAVADEEDEGPISELNLDSNARTICYFREGKFHHAEPSDKLKKGDHLIFLTDYAHIESLHQQWKNKQD